jgi:hypothetical protein
MRRATKLLQKCNHVLSLVAVNLKAIFAFIFPLSGVFTESNGIRLTSLRGFYKFGVKFQ